MAEINIGSLSGGGGGGGGGTWLKPEMEGGNNVEITSNQYLRFYKNPATGAYLELNMSGSIPFARIIDANGNTTILDGNSLDFASAMDPTNPANSSYLPAEIRIKTFEGGDPAGLYFVCLDLNHNLAATLNLIRGTYGGTTGSSDPVEDGMLIGEIAFWGQDNAGIVTPGVVGNINKPSRISVYATEDYTETQRGSEMVIYNTEAGTTTQRGNFRFLGTGQNRMELYGDGNFEDNNPEYFIGVDLDGNLIEVSPGSVGTGDVVGPDESTDNAIVRWDGITGKIIQDSGVIVDDANNVTTEASFISDNQSGYTTELNSTGVVITDEFSNTNTQTAGSIVIDSPDNESTSTLDYNSLHIDNPGDDKTANFGFNGVFLTDQGGIEDLTISVTSIDAANLLTAILGGYNFSVSESKAGKDGYVLTYDEGANVINLQPGGGGGSGDVTGPASSTDNAIVRFDGTTGKVIQNSSATIDDNGRTVISSNTDSGFILTLVNSTGSGTADRVAMKSENGGVSAPSALGSNANGDKWVFWSNSNFKGAIGFNAFEMWYQATSDGSGTPLFRWYLGTASSPTESMRLTTTGLSINTAAAAAVDLDINSTARVRGGEIQLDATGATKVKTGSGNPEGVTTASPGSLFLDTGGNVYLKDTGTGNTGWVEIATTTTTVNVYNTSANLTGNRQISGDGFSLNIFNTSTFQIEDVTNVMNLEVTPTDVSFFDGAFNFSAADLPFNNQIIKMDSGNITGSNVMSETGTAITFAAPLYEIDGAESLPSYSNTGDTDTGIFFPAADAVGISTGATEKVRVDALGLRLMTSFTPTGTADATGATGAVSWDDDYIYVKTSAGWKRSALSTF